MSKEPRLIVNNGSGNLFQELKSSIETCRAFYFSVAFLNFSGLQLLLEALKEAETEGTKGKILTSTYLNFTDPGALRKLREFPSIESKVFITDKTGFHTKAYIFEYDDYYKVIIGSSNITQHALKSNVEWNVELISKDYDVFMTRVFEEFDSLWARSNKVDDEFLHDYEELVRNLKQTVTQESLVFEKSSYVTPNTMQKRAMENLDRLRGIGEEKALVIAATGTGKTYMSAFDVRRVQPKRLLFVVHREEILQKAKETFKYLLHNFDVSFGLLTGSQKDFEADYLFANIRTLHNHYDSFDPEAFDYIVYDEAHHVTAPTYQEVFEYFDADFTLGMTATPERGDQQSIFEQFDQNVALEVRLHDALEDDIIVPFHYFGVTDINDIDLSDVSIDDIDEITRRLKVNERVDFIIKKMNFYGHDGEKRKGLGFCASREHARYMVEEFRKRGIPSLALDGDNTGIERQEAIQRLESEEDEVEFLFTVDIFNEGVDIPSVNTVLMLRPTNSPIIFIQQLGRGLRKHEGKEFLTVLDFIGNHAKTFLIAIALNGQRYYDKESLKVAISTGFAHLPGATHIEMDEISKERILTQIDQESFMSMKYLREQYQEFKRVRAGNVPYWLMDYYTYENAPDPVSFIKKKRTYLEFTATAEKDEHLKALIADDTFEKSLKWLSSMLPLKRSYDFAVLRALLHRRSLTIEEAEQEMKKWVDEVPSDSVDHALRYVNQEFFDSGEKERTPKLASFDGETLERTVLFDKLIGKEEYRSYLLDVLEYGLLRYEREFGSRDYGLPHFKLYEQYQMADAALLSNYRKSHSAFRGSGLLQNGNDYFLFIDLHKEAYIKESINYNDKLVSRDQFQWETPNSTTQDSKRGKNILYNRERGIRLHLFVRKYKQIENGITEPYIYIGQGDAFSWQGQQPIEVQLELHHRLPEQLYTELTEKV
ncbi:DEAD/DEAH box helicase [Salimicrobium halophilum]|uniref:PLD-like domain-containing protein n=1 Tax=Salimicrobium halophilum TaxID=86666 RepID=A0A1G8T7N8_9BACI|nr:DEAD/DEAH box helicase [Salimicrobium halophilum]SDJ37558.1 PLD-like domain-containing protein [Salimicrobium halophilum]